VEGDRVIADRRGRRGLRPVELEHWRTRLKGVVATRGDEGLALAHEFRPDAIILDMKLPVRDGWDVLDHLKRHPETRHIPVHIVSGGVENGGAQAALRAGAVAVLEKPVAADRLQDAFARMSEFVDTAVRKLLVVTTTRPSGRRSSSCWAGTTRDHRCRLVQRHSWR
jgi:CheY-like chemotaxis protein